MNKSRSKLLFHKKTQLLFVRCIDYLHNRRTFTHTVIYEFMQIV
mgnify:CR=1 FL=1